MELKAAVVRCGYCAAPLTRAATDVVVRCAYCETENFIEATALGQQQAARIQLAAAQYQMRSSEAQARAQMLRERMTAELRAGKKHEALHTFESYLRVTYAPTLQFLRTPGIPNAEASLLQIDATIEKALAAFASQQGISR